MWTNVSFLKIALIAALLDVFSTETAIPLECDPNFILLQDEASCLELFKSNGSSAEQDCTGLWDQLNCWPHAVIGEIVSQPCPRFLQTTGRLYRNCTEQGWTEPYPPHEVACEYAFSENLTILPEAPKNRSYFFYVQIIYSVGYSVSLISLSIAVVILCLFRRLHCTRNSVHIQLFLSFILRAALIFVRDLELFYSKDHFHCNVYPVRCKLATTMSNYSIMANYSWLLAEGHYLYSLVSATLVSRKGRLWRYILLSWGAPICIMLGWCLARYLYEDEGCWETRLNEWIWWILRVPVLLFIIVNFGFFLCIIQILVAKLKTQDMPGNEFNHYRKLAKSTFLLVSLFGLHYIIFAFLPHKVNDSTYRIWNFIELCFASTQGCVVAVLYCFLNAEVQLELQRRWRRWRVRKCLQRSPRRQSGGPPNSTGLLLHTRPSSTVQSSLV